MSFVGSEKIFVDPNQEITFLLEKVFSTKKAKIILVVPEYSIILSSIISLKILLKLGHREGKSFILVTESTTGFPLSQRAGLITVRKVSQITSDLWEAALNRQIEEIKRAGKDKDKFNEYAEESTEEQERIMKKQEEIAQEKTIFEKLKAEREDEEHLKDLNSLLWRNSKKRQPVKEIKLEPQVVTLGGIQIVSGGDVKKLQEDGKMNTSIDTKNTMERKIDLPEDRTLSVDRFAGKDISRTGSRKSLLSSIKKNLGINQKNNFTDREEQLKNTSQSFWKSRIFLVGVSICTFIAVIIYFVIFQWSYLTINIRLKTQQLQSNTSVTALLDSSRKNIDENIIEARLESIENITQSRTAIATGEGRTGEKAKGFVYMLNRNEQEIILPPGTQITSVATAQVYVLVNSTTLPAARRITDGSLDPSRVDGIQVEASTFGEEYNITSVSENNVFTISSTVPGGTEINVRRESVFEGGTLETFTSVSRENVDEIADTILDEIKTRAINELRSNLEDGFILLEETVQFEEQEVTASPDIDAEALEDNTFTVSISTRINAYSVRESDLEELIAKASNNNQGRTNTISISNIEITNVTISATGISFELTSSATAAEGIDQEEFINQFSGKSVSEVQEYLASQENIESFRLNYVPSAVPESLRVAPLNKDNIKLIVTDN